MKGRYKSKSKLIYNTESELKSIERTSNTSLILHQGGFCFFSHLKVLIVWSRDRRQCSAANLEQLEQLCFRWHEIIESFTVITTPCWIDWINLPCSTHHLDVQAPNYIKLSKATPQTYILYGYLYRCLKTFNFSDPIPHKLNGVRLVHLIQRINKLVTSKLGAKQQSIWPNRTSQYPNCDTPEKGGFICPQPFHRLLAKRTSSFCLRLPKMWETRLFPWCFCSCVEGRQLDVVRKTGNHRS